IAKTDGTTGLPLGGIGTGAIKYAASSGTFAANFRTPTRDGDYDPLSETHFQIFIQRGDSILTNDLLEAYQTGGRVDDDAIFPLHRVNFGEMNDVSVEMTAYMPYYPDSIPMMLHPCAMFEFEVENLESDSVTVALAFKIETPVVPAAIPDTGFTANDASLELCLIGYSPESTGVLSYGNDNGFFTDGLCDNNLSGNTNRLALRVSLASSETKIVRFVLSWYQPDEKEHYRYTNYWENAKEAGISALANFDAFKDIDEELVNRMRNSNLPEWLVDQTLNSLANLVNNSVYFQDGRYCHTEGMWHPEGTMDQMWHARQIYTMINPELAWRELEWWARTQHVDNHTGQIHHDFGTYFNYVGWDDTEHEDYRPIYEWVDLNCGFIISVYEAFIATEDINELTYFWDPYVKRAGQRILNQVDEYGSAEYPYTFANSLSTYDAGGNSQAYNTGLSVVAYQIMIHLAEIM
ncbi:MAG: GH116 family glycosyl-hydrolase, partial [candidate division WOR-3 bacterium]